jgi:hypothetical protein
MVQTLQNLDEKFTGSDICHLLALPGELGKEIDRYVIFEDNEIGVCPEGPSEHKFCSLSNMLSHSGDVDDRSIVGTKRILTSTILLSWTKVEKALHVFYLFVFHNALQLYLSLQQGLSLDNASRAHQTRSSLSSTNTRLSTYID